MRGKLNSSDWTINGIQTVITDLIPPKTISVIISERGIPGDTNLRDGPFDGGKSNRAEFKEITRSIKSIDNCPLHFVR